MKQWNNVLLPALLMVMLVTWCPATAHSVGASQVTNSDSRIEQVQDDDLGWARQVAGGYEHTCAVTATDGVRCWGSNQYGQLGDGTTYRRSAPQDVVGLAESINMVAAGGRHTCALTVSGGVQCWGRNLSGELGDGTLVNSMTPVYVSGLTSGVRAISAGFFSTCALLESGGVKCWGENGYGQLGDGTRTDRPAPVDVVGLGVGVQSIGARNDHACAITAEGALKCWGDNDGGMLGDGTRTDRSTPVPVVGLDAGVTAVDTGLEHTCAVTIQGGVKCWGGNGLGQLGTGAPGEDQLTPGDVVGLAERVVAVSVGEVHTCALTSRGGVQCWGYGGHGRLGDGSGTSSYMPVAVHGLSTGAVQLSAGNDHTCVVIETGAMQCWGDNRVSQLGDGTISYRLVPTDVWDMAAYDCAAVTEIPQRECAALASFFRAANGSSWLNHTGWLRSALPCSWHGVSCTDGRVSRLDLPANKLTDHVAAAIGDLADLQRLDLHDNTLVGALPAELGNAGSLQYLDLSANRLNGTLPAELGNAGSLQYLDLSANRLNGELPPELGHLVALQNLKATDNALSGQLPPQLGALTALLYLDLSANELSGSLPPELGRLRSLRILDLRDNQLNGPLPAELGELVSLHELDLSRNVITGEIPSRLGAASSLLTIDLHDNQLSGALPWTLGQLTNLTRLDLARNQLTGPLPHEWSLLAHLQHLDLTHNQLADWLPSAYGQLASLRLLDFSFNELHGPLPASWSSLHLLETLNLNNNHLAGPIPATWGTLGSAATYPDAPPVVPPQAWWSPTPPPGMYADLSCNRLSGEIPRELSAIHRLVAFNVASNQLRGAVPTEFLHPAPNVMPHLFKEDNLLEPRDPTQVLPPVASATLSAPDAATLSWPLQPYWSYETYEISLASAPEGPFTVVGEALTGTEAYTVTGLTPGVASYFRVRVFVPAHGTQDPGWEPIFHHDHYQQNNLWSDYTPIMCVNCAAEPDNARVYLPMVSRHE